MRDMINLACPAIRNSGDLIPGIQLEIGPTCVVTIELGDQKFGGPYTRNPIGNWTHMGGDH